MLSEILVVYQYEDNENGAQLLRLPAWTEMWMNENQNIRLLSGWKSQCQRQTP
jgi:hypothetical protein